MTMDNSYRAALEVKYGLFAVLMEDGGWAIADGAGTLLTPEDEICLSGYHLPVRFKTKEKAIGAIMTGPFEMFDIAPDSVWTAHAVASGGVIDKAYLMPSLVEER